METMDILDVTVIEPRLKHPTIFQKFDVLEKGDSFVIHNDHDPKPLYYQLLAERGNIFTWQYLEEGPEWWKVQIGKLKEGEKEATIGDIVSKDFRKAEVFKKFGLDFCCGGKKTLAKACREKGIDVVQVEKELKAVEEKTASPSQDFNTWDLGFLADYIVNTHHKYVLQAMPVIFEYTQKVAKVHGERHPEAIEIANLFLKVVDELNRHMMKEENVLFPYIKILTSTKKDLKNLEPSPFGTIENPVRMMEMEHEQVGDLVESINKLSNGYTPPTDACTTFRLSYAKLKEFEDDLHQHIHLENNILFPKAIALEKNLSE
ncbi:MAG: iron-sulfur cluster repair di-iron protein [Bacteroidetes bacterium]|nr:iron-sulfur cluster repair di-iron protein [Bacteroidota bacterium]